MANRRSRTIVPKLISISLLCLLLLVAVPVALAEPGKDATPTPVANATVTPTPDVTITPTPTSAATPTPTPTPAPRKVLSSAKWENDHVSMLVTNSGGPIMVEAYIDDPSNAVTTTVKQGATVRVNTNSITAEQGQIIVFGFKAYENGTQIDKFEGTLVAGQTQVSPTPPPETASLSGTITDASTGAPVEGAEVVLKSQSYGKQYEAMTDSSGTFITGSIYPDTYDIIITKAGYKQEIRHTMNRIEGMQQMDAISIQKVPSGVTPTVVPTPTPTPTPTSPLDAWIALLYTPTACMATITGSIGLIVSLTVIYEWYMRQKERRAREAQLHQEQHQRMQQQLKEQQEREAQRERLQDQQERQQDQHERLQDLASDESAKND